MILDIHHLIWLIFLWSWILVLVLSIHNGMMYMVTICFGVTTSEEDIPDFTAQEWYQIFGTIISHFPDFEEETTDTNELELLLSITSNMTESLQVSFTQQMESDWMIFCWLSLPPVYSNSPPAVVPKYYPLAFLIAQLPQKKDAVGTVDNLDSTEPKSQGRISFPRSFLTNSWSLSKSLTIYCNITCAISSLWAALNLESWVSKLPASWWSSICSWCLSTLFGVCYNLVSNCPAPYYFV